MPRLPPPPHPLLPREQPLFDQLTTWAGREEHRALTLSIGFGLFCASILWLLYALR